MNYILSDHIISPVAVGTEANLHAVIRDETALKMHNQAPLEAFCASIFGGDVPIVQDGFSPFENLCVAAIEGATTPITQNLLSHTDTIFIISSTKGNVEKLAIDEDPSLRLSAKKMTDYFHNPNPAIVVCNACISGVCALITAQRLLERGKYKHAVVVGSDVISPFIVSGFQSFKALSDERCCPFDAQRKGLNLGEAAACMILSNDESFATVSKGTILAGSIHNDANHISGPSRTGEGSYLCLKDVINNDIEDIAFVNLHGTATLYNDEMESIAIERAGLQDVPVNTLKSIYGHCLGAAGLLETILSLHALHNGLVLPVWNFSEQGTTYPLNISTECRTTDKHEFIKLISGFGGCNAAIRVSINSSAQPIQSAMRITNQQTIAEVKITPNSIIVDGEQLKTEEHGEKLLTELYRTYVNNYPKFFKMDTLSRLGFVASEMLLRVSREKAEKKQRRAIVLANSNASLKNDTDYQKTIQDIDNYYPSPALFVYTLPNIVTGEIAIRNGYKAETSFYVLDDESALWELVELFSYQAEVDSVICGWVDCKEKDIYEAHLKLIQLI